jgi:hypothetical protein
MPLMYAKRHEWVIDKKTLGKNESDNKSSTAKRAQCFTDEMLHHKGMLWLQTYNVRRW